MASFLHLDRFKLRSNCDRGFFEVDFYCDHYCTNAGISVMPRTETKHPLDPLSAAEISVAVATVRAAGANPEVRKLYSFSSSRMLKTWSLP